MPQFVSSSQFVAVRHEFVDEVVSVSSSVRHPVYKDGVKRRIHTDPTTDLLAPSSSNDELTQLGAPK